MTIAQKEQALKSLIDMGVRGHFLFIHSEWMKELNLTDFKFLTKKDKKRANDILDSIIQHRTNERRMIVLSALSAQERTLFLYGLLNMVENRLIDAKPTLH